MTISTNQNKNQRLKTNYVMMELDQLKKPDI